MMENEFDNRLREMMESYGEMPEASSWDGIASSLAGSRRRLWMKRSFATVAAAAAVVALFFIAGGDDILIKQKIEPQITVVQNAQEAVSDSSEVPAKVVTVRSESRALHADAKGSMSIKQEEVTVMNPVAVAASADKNPESPVIEKKIPQTGEKSIEMVEFEESLKNRLGKRGKPVLAFSAMLSPAASNEDINLLSLSNANHKDLRSSMDREQVSFDNVSDTRFLPPLTIGLQLMLPVDRIFSLGTGINYSLLYSITEEHNRFGTDRTEQTLHYIGVPLFLQIYLYKTPKLNLYANTGVTLEKGLAVRFKRTGSLPSDEIMRVSGFQWSIGSGLGVEYMIGKHTGLYADPLLTYYFRSNQPMNIRTAEPLQFRMEIGFRYRF
ncbi:MAG: hypothetical protein CVT93_04425 [Bacteroidetes bacterium HGW-Bacteroidetes-10]|nr:MAG: hypothetical protein CVT93_04425 [Bacteroidetes bacterium HGW-Bacteroidetes-10]